MEAKGGHFHPCFIDRFDISNVRKHLSPGIECHPRGQVHSIITRAVLIAILLLLYPKKELNTTATLINLTVTCYMVFQGVSPTLWGSLSDSWGRRPIYLSTLIVYLGTCVGCALAPDYASLLVLRMLQAFGSSSVIALGMYTMISYAQ